MDLVTNEEAKVARKAFDQYQHGLLAQGCYPTSREMLDFVNGESIYPLGEETLLAIGDTMSAILMGEV